MYDQRYYRYADPQYSITDMPLSEDDFLLLKKAVDLLGKNENLPQNGEIYKVLKKKEPLDSNSELCINEKAPVPADGTWSFL